MSVLYKNPGVTKNVRSGEDAGDLTLNMFVFDLAKVYAPGATAVASGDQIQIGTIPGGEHLVAHLSRLDLPALGVANTIGTPTTANAIMATGPVAAGISFGEDFTLATADVGAPDADTPVLITFGAGGSLPTTGKIVLYQVSRTIRSDIDGQDT